MTLPHLDAGEVARRRTPAQAADALEAALRAGLDPEADPARVALSTGRGELLVMPSAAARHAVVKLVTVGGDPRIQGLCIAFDPDTLAPAALIDGIALTNLRTAAVSTLAVRHLAAPDPRRMVVFGRGPQARAHARALTAEHDLDEPPELLGRDDPRAPDLVAAADLIVCATTARTPLFDGALVAGHATVVAIGSHEPDARETDDALARRATVVVESRASALREAGDVLAAIEAGALDPEALIPLAALVRGDAAARPDPARPRLFKSTGMAWEDAVVASALLDAS
jgi:ornithine cyclodeaminase/alanine dehydrogenase-like protein (mu-crystallin family)